MIRKIKIVLLLLPLCFFAIGQGGPKANTIKFVGNINTETRDAFSVPTGEVWLIYNIDCACLEYGNSNQFWRQLKHSNELGGIIQTTAQNYVEVGTDGPVGGSDFVRISGGTSPDEPLLYITDNYFSLTNYTNADIETTGDGSVITKKYLDARLPTQSPDEIVIASQDSPLKNIQIAAGSQAELDALPPPPSNVVRLEFVEENIVVENPELYVFANPMASINEAGSSSMSFASARATGGNVNYIYYNQADHPDEIFDGYFSLGLENTAATPNYLEVRMDTDGEGTYIFKGYAKSSDITTLTVSDYDGLDTPVFVWTDGGDIEATFKEFTITFSISTIVETEVSFRLYNTGVSGDVTVYDGFSLKKQ